MSTRTESGAQVISPAITRACREAGAAAAAEIARSDLPLHMDAMIAAMWAGFDAAHEAIEAQRIAEEPIKWQT